MFFENSENFVFCGHLKNFFNFGGQNHKSSQTQDSHFVDLDILHIRTSSLKVIAHACPY